MLPKGIIVSIQGYYWRTIEELALDAITAGAVAVRTDKPIFYNTRTKEKYNRSVPIIGLNKKHVSDPTTEAYITTELDEINKISEWADYIAVDYREINRNLFNLSNYCRENRLKVVADIATIQDYQNIKKNDLHYTYIATTLSVFSLPNEPDFKLLDDLITVGEKNIIAEGNFKTRSDVYLAYRKEIKNICIGGAISNIYKLTQKFTSVT